MPCQKAHINARPYTAHGWRGIHESIPLYNSGDCPGGKGRSRMGLGLVGEKKKKTLSEKIFFNTIKD